ncbi:MAG: hypothetical protein NC548_26690 [Lachnospiraceae bacterium]|nr:hypothetical protein [Lachnospiraceae bacterium]
MAKRLIAQVAILHGNKQYQPGEELPKTDPAYASAWVEAGSAVWEDESDGAEEKPTKKKTAAKARPKTAPAGATGIAQPATGAEADLAGKVPSKKARGVIEEPDKRPPKSQA